MLPLRGFGLLASRPALLGLAALPVLLTGLAGLGAAMSLFSRREALLALVVPRPAACSDCSWLGGAAAGVAAFGWQVLSYAGWFLVSAAAALVVARVASAPLLDLLSQRIARDLGLRAGPAGAWGDLPLHRSLPRSIGRAAGRFCLLMAGWALLLPLALVPGGAVVATPLELAWTGIWLFVDTSVYALQWVGPASLADVRALARAEPARSAGFAAMLGALLLVPLAGLLVAPAAVAGACLLAAEVSPEPTPAPVAV